MSADKLESQSDLPELSTTRASRADLPGALHLVADSVAQQRQVAARSVILHPLTISTWVLFMAVVYQVLTPFPTRVTTAAGVTMSMLIGVRWLCKGYVEEAEKIGERWLTGDEGGQGSSEEETRSGKREDVVLVTKWGGNIVGALVMRLKDAAGGAGPTKKTRGSSVASEGVKGEAILRAWTVKLKYRHKGLGRHLLEEAVRIARQRFGDRVVIAWDRKHANSVNFIPDLFDRPFQTREELARDMLVDVIDEQVAMPAEL